MDSSAVTQTVVTKADGTQIIGPVDTVATRGNGSWVLVMYRYNAAGANAVRWVRLASGYQGSLSDARRQKWATPMSAEANPAAPSNRRVASSFCTIGNGGYKESALGEEQIGGYRAEKVVSGNHTAWYALDYGCAGIKDHVEWADGQKSDKYLIALHPGEPDSSLLAVPSSYKDVSQLPFSTEITG